MAALNGKFRSTKVSVNPGHDMKLLLRIAFFHVDFTGEKHAAWRYLTRSDLVCFFQMMTEIFDVTGILSHSVRMSEQVCADIIFSKSFMFMWLTSCSWSYDSILFERPGL